MYELFEILLKVSVKLILSSALLGIVARTLNRNGEEQNEKILGDDQRDFEPKKLVMISAMYENGGNVTHRLLDGNPELMVYPFESQMGNGTYSDYLSSLFPYKYRWPSFPLNAEASEYYNLFFDEELKTLVRNPKSSKFQDIVFEFDEKKRFNEFNRILSEPQPTPKDIVIAFFASTFSAWKNYNDGARKKKYYVGYSPIIGIDVERMVKDIPDIKVIHIVRNPFSAYAETKKRPFPLSMHRYINSWKIIQLMLLDFKGKYPRNLKIYRYEDLISNTHKIMNDISKFLGISFNSSMLRTSFNGNELQSVFPWGTISSPTVDENQEIALTLNGEEKIEILRSCKLLLNELEYESFVDSIIK